MARDHNSRLRAEVKENNEKRQGEYQDLTDRKSKRVIDAEILRDLARDLEEVGTDVAREAISGHVEKAKDITMEQAKEIDEAIETKYRESEELEGDLNEAAEEDRQGENRAAEASDQIEGEEAKQEGRGIQDRLREDLQFLEQENKTNTEGRETTREKQNQLQARLDAAAG